MGFLRNREVEGGGDDISIPLPVGGLERNEPLDIEISESDRFRFSTILGS